MFWFSSQREITGETEWKLKLGGFVQTPMFPCFGQEVVTHRSQQSLPQVADASLVEG